MKYDAIVGQGIQILERVPIPDELIPEDSRVEIDAKIHAGYCEQKMILHESFKCQYSGCSNFHDTVTTGKKLTTEELSLVQGRPWDDIDVCSNTTL